MGKGGNNEIGMVILKEKSDGSQQEKTQCRWGWARGHPFEVVYYE